MPASGEEDIGPVAGNRDVQQNQLADLVRRGRGLGERHGPAPVVPDQEDLAEAEVVVDQFAKVGGHRALVVAFGRSG
jgi:hypothetical protein